MKNEWRKLRGRGCCWSPASELAARLEAALVRLEARLRPLLLSVITLEDRRSVSRLTVRWELRLSVNRPKTYIGSGFLKT